MKYPDEAFIVEDCDGQLHAAWHSADEIILSMAGQPVINGYKKFINEDRHAALKKRIAQMGAGMVDLVKKLSAAEDEISRLKSKKRRRPMVKYLFFVAVLCLPYLSACSQLTKPEIAPSTTLATTVKEYTGTFSADGSFSVSVPEIFSKRDSTTVDVFWSYPTSASIWTPMKDGWLDDTTKYGHIANVSWDFGRVFMNYVGAGENYLIIVRTFN